MHGRVGQQTFISQPAIAKAPCSDFFTISQSHAFALRPLVDGGDKGKCSEGIPDGRRWICSGFSITQQ